jgi:hypothetical protein
MHYNINTLIKPEYMDVGFENEKMHWEQYAGMGI